MKNITFSFLKAEIIRLTLALASHLSHYSHTSYEKSYVYVNVHLLYNIQPYMYQWIRIWKKSDLNVNSQPWDHKGQPNSVSA